VHCDVVAPTLVPVKSGDRVKTNRRDAEKLARCYRSGELTAVWVPDAAHEALRDLVRAREVAKKDQLRARHRLGKFLLRRGLRAAAGLKSWTAKHLLWVKTLHFVLGEFRYGIAQSKRRASYEAWLESSLIHFDILSATDETAVAYAALRLTLKQSGRPIPANDAWIAALALQHRLPVLSRDEHFDVVPGLNRRSW
jgi:predicted nucleic acid-binding protein